MRDAKTGDQVRNRTLTPILKIEKVSPTCIAGIYEGSYWGHSYKNDRVGDIPADSINLRPFFFLLYLSRSGKIYLASQYLGHFGGYTAIRNSVLKGLEKSSEVAAKSFNFWGVNYDALQAREVEIKFSKGSTSITGSNLFGSRGAISLYKDKDNPSFEKDVTEKIIKPVVAHPKKAKKIIAELLRSQKVAEISDDDIKDCKLVAYVDGHRKVVHLFDESSWATRFPVNVPLNDQGHPEYEPLKNLVVDLLKKQVITKVEDV